MVGFPVASLWGHRVAGRREVVAAAGVATEARHGYDWNLDAAADDLRGIEAAAYDAGTAVNVGRSVAIAGDLVAPYYREVKALASELEARGWVDGAEAARILGLDS